MPAEMSGVLEPKLTALDKRILRAIPLEWDDAGATAQPGIDIWALGRELDDTDLEALLRILRGLEHFGLVYRCWNGSKKPDQWNRTQKGTEAIA